jgi:hypothetical protein
MATKKHSKASPKPSATAIAERLNRAACTCETVRSLGESLLSQGGGAKNGHDFQQLVDVMLRDVTRELELTVRELGQESYEYCEGEIMRVRAAFAPAA